MGKLTRSAATRVTKMHKSQQLFKLTILTSMIIFFTANQSHGATATANMPVSVRVIGTCTVAANPFVFPDYDPTAGIVQSNQAAITVECPNLRPYAVTLSTGNSGTYAQRQMQNIFTTNLGYQLFLDPAYTLIWGDATGGTFPNLGIGNGVGQPLTVYGQIPAGQLVPTGLVYRDNITVTVTY